MYDLSSDEKATPDTSETFTTHQLLMERVITRVLLEYNICCAVDDELRALFKAKLWRMGQKISKAGSTARKKIFAEWRSGPHSTWEIKINAEKFKKGLLKQKKKLEEKIESEYCKRLKTEQELCHSKLVLKETQLQQQCLQRQLNRTQAELKKVCNDNKMLSSSNKRLSSSLAGSANKRQRQDISLVSRQQQWVRKKQIHNNVNQALLFLEAEGIKPKSLVIQQTTSNQVDMLDLEKGTFTTVDHMNKENDAKISEKILYVKEKFGISDSAYHELSMIFQDLPRSYQLKKIALELNTTYEIKICPNGKGVQQSIQSRLEERLKILIREKKINCGDTIQLKLSGDGTKVCRKLNLINFTFTLLNEGDLAKSPKGNHTVAILKSTEDYDDLKEGLLDICKEVERLNSITVNGSTYPIEYFLCSDLKFLAIICGIQSANSVHACIWCTCPSSERHNMDLEWSIDDVNKGARTNDSIIACLKKPVSERLGCKNMPLFPTIPINHVTPDVLHLFLRITDVLFDLLIMDIRREDAIDKGNRLDRLQSFLNNECKIPFEFKVSKETKKLQWRDLMGPEKIIFFGKINLVKEFPTIPNIHNIHELWKDFKSLHKLLQNENISDVTAHKFEEDAKDWVRLFTNTYQAKHVTPYIHILANHVPEFLEKYGNLVQFTQQGMEKLNDETTINFARSTNHNFHNLDALKQLMQKKNRIEYLQDAGNERTSLTHKCSTCKEIGHNKLRCPKKTPHL